MTFQGLKTYLRETTIHGLRYIVDSKTFIEKIIWVAVLLTAFSYSTFFIITAIDEANKDPIMSNVEIVDGKDIDFPAVTVFSGGYIPFMPYRFVTAVLNSLPFPCRFEDKCSDEELALRADYKPLLMNIVRAVLEKWKVASRNGRHYRDELEDSLVDILCKLSPTRPEVIIHNLPGVKDVCKKGLSVEEEDGVIEALVDSPDLRYWWENVPVMQYLQGLITDEEVNGNMTCDPKAIQSSPLGPLLDLVPMIRELLPKSRLGDLLEYSYISVLMCFDEDSQIRPNREGGNSSLYSDEVLNSLRKTDGDLIIPEVLRQLFAHPPQMTSIRKDFLQWAGPEGACSEVEEHQYDETGIFDDCLKNKVHENLAKALKNVKYLYQPASKKMFANSSFLYDATKALKLSEYGASCLQNGTCLHSDPIMSFCHKGFHEPNLHMRINYLEQNCPDFELTFGHRGLRHTMNSKSFWQMYQRNEYHEAFFDEFINKHDYEEKEELSSDTIFDFYLLPSTFGLYRTYDSEFFPLAFHHPREIPSRGSVKLEAGNTYTVTLTPSMITTDPEVKDLPIEKRGCRFSDEIIDFKTDQGIFKYYSRSTCFLECKIRQGYNTANCIPFDYPHFESPTSLCNQSGIYTFYGSYDEVTQDDCDCPPDCDIYSYGTDVVKEKLRECHDIQCDKILEFLSGLSTGSVNFDPCKEGCHRNLIRLVVRMDTATVVNTKRRRRTSTTDQIASLGGLVGLFTGMSMLSVAELLMWLLRTVAGAALSKLLNKY